jgi:DNA-directed RNA polymerase subunit alpha
MSEKEYLEMKKKVNQYEYNQHRKEMKRIQNQKPSINDLDISVRLYNIFKENEIHTIDELLSKSVSDFLRMKKFGRKCAREVEILYRDKGWEFANK